MAWHNNPSNPKVDMTSGYTIEMNEKKAMIMDLRRQGLSFGQIEAKTGVSKPNAQRWCKKYVKEILTKSAEELLAAELERFAKLEAVAMESVTKFTPLFCNGQMVQAPILGPDLRPILTADGKPLMTPVQDRYVQLAGIAAVLRVQAQRCTLLGLNAPTAQRAFIHHSTDETPQITFRVIDAQGGIALDAPLTAEEEAELEARSKAGTAHNSGQEA